MSWSARLKIAAISKSCWLGLHIWTWSHPERTRTPKDGDQRCCLRCGKRQILAFQPGDHPDGEWYPADWFEARGLTPPQDQP